MLIIKNTKFSLFGVFFLLLLSFLSVNYAHPTTSSPIKIIEQTEETCSGKFTAKKTKPVKVPATESHTETKNNRITVAVYEFRKEYGKLMLSYMNQSVDPCEDFYEYACGNWKNIKLERISTEKSSNILSIDYKIAKSVGDILERSTTEMKHDNAAELKLAQQYYQACLNANLYPMTASADYLRVIKSIGGFPAVDATWNASTFSWFNMSAHLSNYGVDGLVYEVIAEYYPFGPYFELPELGFEYIVHSDNIQTNETRGYKLNERRMRKYLNLYAVNEIKIKKVISEIFDFWHEVLSLADRFDEDHEKCQNISFQMSPEPYFSQWINYFEIAWHGKDFNLYADDYPCAFFYVELNKICEKHKEAVANYLAMKFLYKMDARLTESQHQKYYCQLNIKNSFPYILDKFYLLEHFNDEIHSDVALIVKEIRKSLRSLLANADWLDTVTRRRALLKESNIISRIGNIKAPEQTERLIREMNNLTFVDGGYAQNNMNLKKFQSFMKRFNGLHQEQLPETVKSPESLLGFEVNAFYDSIDNSIYIMAGMLNPPFYHKYWPNSLKYGTIGATIGHELTHAFDMDGCNAKNQKLWSKKSREAFNKRVNCHIDQYNGYQIPKINRRIDGYKTRDENIADGAGLRQAFNAYGSYMKQLTSELEKNEQMPGLDLSPEQIFFLGYAQTFCSAYKEEDYWYELNDEHAIDKYRVIGSVINNNDFAAVYNCPLGSKMHPKADKCHLW